MKLDRVFSAFNIGEQGLTAQRRRMDSIASNLANAETTRTEQGGPYRRKLVQFSAKGQQLFSNLLRQAGLPLSRTDAGHFPAGTVPVADPSGKALAIDVRETEDQSPPRLIHDPGNPDADANGYVQMPNVNIVTEMVGMVAASRAFEANVVAINAAKGMAKDSLEI